MTPTTIRKWHSYLSLFVAPSVLFFALTGAAQIFNLHEAHGSYQPPAIVEKLSSVHKDQVFAFGGHHVAARLPAQLVRLRTLPKAPSGTQGQDDRARLPTMLLKWFFLVVALCLVISTAFGIWMGLTQIRARRMAWLLMIAGTVTPVGLLLVTRVMQAG